MSRPRPVASYRCHRKSGQAVTTLTDGLGCRRDVLLGKYGCAASRQQYARVIAEWEAAGRRLPAENSSTSLTINELALAFLRHGEEYYRRPDGTPTSEVIKLKMSPRPLVHLYGHTPVAEFGPLALKAIRKLRVEGYDHPKYGPQVALSRGVVNHRTNRIRRAFKWGVANELVPPAVQHSPQAVTGLKRGRTEARDLVNGVIKDWGRSGLLAPGFFVPTEGMLAFRGAALRVRAADPETDNSLKELPALDNWFENWATPRTKRGKPRLIGLSRRSADALNASNGNPKTAGMNPSSQAPGAESPAPPTPSRPLGPSAPFVPTAFQAWILEALDKRIRIASQLQNEVGCDRKRLYRDRQCPRGFSGKCKSNCRILVAPSCPSSTWMP
jgi:hypothetical protein